MFSDHRWRKPFIVVLTVSVLVLLLVLGTHFAVANRETIPVSQEAQPKSPTGWGDDGITEVGVEWIDDFPGTADDRSHWDESCDGLYNQLLSTGWTSRFHWTDWNAYETDFKNESLGGQEDTYVDSVDIAMVCTHGSGTYDSFWGKDLSSVYFGSSHTDQDLSPGDAYKAFGDKDLEWLAFDSCSVLSDGGAAPYYNRGYWSTSMNGLHLLLGFKNTMYVWAPGDGLLWGFYMKGLSWFLPPSTVMQAWFQAVDYVQPGVTCARVLAETPDNYNDHLWGYGYVSPDPTPDGWYWYWDHCSTGPALIQELSSKSQPDLVTMPVVQVLDRTVNEDYVRQVIAPAFGLTGDIGMDDMFYYMADTSGGITATLQVDRMTGSYSFHNLSELWTTPVVTPSLPSNGRIADLLISNWFSQTPAEGLPAAWYRNAGYEFNLEQMIGMYVMPAENGGIQEQQTSNMPADVVMTYPRLIPALAGTTSGSQMVDFPLYGPGARLKIYLGDGGKIIGAQGGSRDVQVMADQVNILPADQVWINFLNNPKLALPEIPFIADTITYNMATLGYYEMPYIEHQTELIPVWYFNASFFANGILLEDNVPVYVPASDYGMYLPPNVSIDNPADGSTFWSGVPISFVGSVTGGTPPYTYEWTSSSDGYLGNTINIISSLGSEIKAGSVFNPSVSLQVTDANGMSGTATISLTIKPIFWIPLINK